MRLCSFRLFIINVTYLIKPSLKKEFPAFTKRSQSLRLINSNIHRDKNLVNSKRTSLYDHITTNTALHPAQVKDTVVYKQPHAREEVETGLEPIGMKLVSENVKVDVKIVIITHSSV